MAGWVKFLKHRVREALVHADRLSRPSATRGKVVLLPSSPGTGESSDLRATALVPELERLGWRAVSIPAQLELAQRRRILKLERPDVVLIQQSRHTYNHPKYYPEYPCVFDADDADILDPRCTQRVIECCRQSAGVIAGSRFLARRFRLYNPNVSVVWTSTYLKPSPRLTPEKGALPVVTWANSDPTASPKEAEFVRRVVLQLGRRVRFRFALYGVTKSRRPIVEEYVAPLRREGIGIDLFPLMEYRKFAESLTRAAVGLTPVDVQDHDYFNQGKSFGKLLAYMSAGVPIVMSDAVDHPLFFRNGVSGILLDNDADAWTDACAWILENPEEGRRMAEAAAVDCRRRLSTSAAARLVAVSLEAARRIGRPHVESDRADAAGAPERMPVHAFDEQA